MTSDDVPPNYPVFLEYKYTGCKKIRSDRLLVSGPRTVPPLQPMGPVHVPATKAVR